MWTKLAGRQVAMRANVPRLIKALPSPSMAQMVRLESCKARPSPKLVNNPIDPIM
jgi:hypothetical protein